MGGGLMQLVAYGAQDIYLTGNPQITFFKVVYRRHTNFSMESIEQTTNGSVGVGNRVTSTISRNGDLVYRLFYEVTGTLSLVNDDRQANVVASIFDNVEIEIGGQRIDRQSGKWMYIWSLLSQQNDSRALPVDFKGSRGTLYQDLTGLGGTNSFTHVAATTGDGTNDDDPTYSFNVPLGFWFCRNPGLALPLIALQYHEVKVVTTFGSKPAHDSLDAKLWADYIYLDTDERRRFAQVSHEYLIEQVQFQAAGAASTTHELNFNHPVKELVWCNSEAGDLSAGGWDFGEPQNLPSGTDGDGRYQIKLNGHDRMSARPLTYFTKQQVWMHHTGPGGLVPATRPQAGHMNAPDGTTDALSGYVGQGSDTIAVYSFALKPEEHQPSGTCNFSRIDNAQLTGPSGTFDVFAVNYNVLRIMSGMGGLAYSN